VLQIARPGASLVRSVATAALGIALGVAIWFQHDTIGAALGEVRTLSIVAVIALLVLTVYERWSRADIVHRLLGEPVGFRRALTIHDVGNAISKSMPLGGALGTAMRWTISRDTGVRPARFATMLIAYGVATTFVTWLLPLVALGVDLTTRPPTATDVAIAAVIAAVLMGSVAFWSVVLRSDRLESWASSWIRRMWDRLATRITAIEGIEPDTGVAEVRRELTSIAGRPLGLLIRTGLAQACGAVILFVALRALGVGSELETTEFFRVFFLAHLAGTFAPTPGGVGVVEAGTTGALVAAGVDMTTALAAVVIYRFTTYVMPMLVGAALYWVWRVRRAPTGSATLANHGASVDTALPHVPRAEDQGLREHRDAGGDDRARSGSCRVSPDRILRERARPVSGESQPVAADS
jgi:uncharacterized protein (TIRG00374 family)